MVGREPQGQIVLQADALKKGWGAFCQSNRGPVVIEFSYKYIKTVSNKICNNVNSKVEKGSFVSQSSGQHHSLVVSHEDGEPLHPK